MNNQIPEQLKDSSFRFFLVAANKKTPLQKRWNTDNCYMFFEPKLIHHINAGGNVSICTGYGNLIVIDFDDKAYQELKLPLLPKTFTVRTAGKGLKHLYYRLDGVMFQKIGIGLENRLCDIQAGKDGVVCPPSKRDGKYYSIVEDRPIANITPEQIAKVFNIKSFRESKRRKFKEEEPQPKKIQESLDIMKKLGVPRTNVRHFKCPFHKMNGTGNLYIGDDGHLFCFHCRAWFRDGEDFKAKFEELNGGIVIE